MPKRNRNKKAKAKARKIVKRKITMRHAPRPAKRRRTIKPEPPAPVADAPPQHDMPSGPMNSPEPVTIGIPTGVNR